MIVGFKLCHKSIWNISFYLVLSPHNYKSSKVRIRKTKVFIIRNKYRLNIKTQKEIIAKLFCTQYSHAMQNDNYPLSLFLANLHKTHFFFCCQRPLFYFIIIGANVYKRKQQHAIYKNRSLHISLFHTIANVDMDNAQS